MTSIEIWVDKFFEWGPSNDSKNNEENDHDDEKDDKDTIKEDPDTIDESHEAIAVHIDAPESIITTLNITTSSTIARHFERKKISKPVMKSSEFLKLGKL